MPPGCSSPSRVCGICGRQWRSPHIICALMSRHPSAVRPRRCRRLRASLRFRNGFDHRVGHEIAYLDSCRERVGEAQALTDLRLKQLAAAYARIANWLSVLQTSLLGALLGTFGVASALGGSFSVPTSVRAAVMALVASMALILPPLAVRWTHGYGWMELIGVAVVGAAAGWVVAVAASSEASLVIVLAAAALGAGVLAATASLANGRRPSKPRRNNPEFMTANKITCAK